ncbi:MAG: PKD domain-containing protein [Thermoanaerobaculia bacterium]
MNSRLVVVAVALSLAPGLALPARAQCTDTTCQYVACRAPAFGAPSTLWGEIQPTDTSQLPADRDNTDWNEFTDPHNENQPHWESLDVENHWIFAGIAYGLQIWDATGSRTHPVRVKLLGPSAFPVWPSDPHNFDPVRDVDAPEGNDNAVAVAVSGDAGVAIFNTTSKTTPLARYGDHNKDAQQIYAARIAGTDYSFTATKNAGLLVHNISAAVARSTLCTEETPGQNTCGVYVRRLGSRTTVSYVDGAGSADGLNHWVAFSSGGNDFGLEIWKVSSPTSPSLVVATSGSSAEFVHGVSLWRKGTSNYYLATRVISGSGTQARIYDFSCLATNTCSSTALPTPIWTASLPAGGAGLFITDSQSGSRQFLYFGDSNRCAQALQDEWLYDVSNPLAPRDITPPARTVGGELTGYWGWYYRRNTTGFNLVNPRMGKFDGEYFYRVAYSLFDIHKLTTAAPSAAFTYSPGTVYRGQPISFTDQSTSAPTSWSWTFQDASPANSSSQNPTGVVFNAVGSKTVGLTASNAFGSSSTSQQLNVLDPAAQVGSVSSTPAAPLLCQTVAFTAQNVTGLAPISYAWQVRNSLNQVVATGSSASFNWNTSTASPDTYTGSVTVSNTGGSDSATSSPIVLAALPTLAFASPGSAPETLNGPPFGSGLVNFRIQTVGATEWRWNWGDNTPSVWTADVNAGTQPTHTYTLEGQYTVTVDIRNCQQAAITSASTLVDITITTPLQAGFAASGLFCTASGCFADTGQAITFVDSSVGTPNFWDYDWDGDGSFEDADHTSPVTSHTYNTAGTYIPRLRVRRASVSSIFSHAVPIIVAGGGVPVVTVTGPSQGEVGLEVAFSAQGSNCSASPTTWTWDVGLNGVIFGSSTGPSVTVIYGSSGARTVTATAADGGNCAGLVGSTNISVAPGAAAVFVDGFESGDLASWGLTFP